MRASRGPSVTGSRKRTTTPSGPRLASSCPAPPNVRRLLREPPRHGGSFPNVLVFVVRAQRDYFPSCTRVAKLSCRPLLWPDCREKPSARGIPWRRTSLKAPALKIYYLKHVVQNFFLTNSARQKACPRPSMLQLRHLKKVPSSASPRQNLVRLRAKLVPTSLILPARRITRPRPPV